MPPRNYTFDVLNGINLTVRQLPLNEVPYFNLGGRRLSPASRSGLLSYNLRQPAAPTPDPKSKPWALVYAATNSSHEFRNKVALKCVRAFLVKWTKGWFTADYELKSGAGESIGDAAEHAHEDAHIESGESRSTARDGPMSTPTRCGGCGEGESPSTMGAIKNKMFRKVWVGYESGDDCQSKNWWFHFRCCDADTGRMRQGRHRWFCSACRGLVDHVLIDDMYIRLRARGR